MDHVALGAGATGAALTMGPAVGRAEVGMTVVGRAEVGRAEVGRAEVGMTVFSDGSVNVLPASFVLILFLTSSSPSLLFSPFTPFFSPHLQRLR